MSDLIGFHAIRECLKQSPQKARCLYVLKTRKDSRINELIGLARMSKIRYQLVESSWFQRRQVIGNHQNVLLDCHDIETETERDLKAKWNEFPSDVRVLVCEGIEDPRNLGACLRTANGAGVDRRMASRPASAGRMRLGGGHRYTDFLADPELSGAGSHHRLLRRRALLAGAPQDDESHRIRAVTISWRCASPHSHCG